MIIKSGNEMHVSLGKAIGLGIQVKDESLKPQL